MWDGDRSCMRGRIRWKERERGLHHLFSPSQWDANCLNYEFSIMTSQTKGGLKELLSNKKLPKRLFSQLHVWLTHMLCWHEETSCCEKDHQTKDLLVDDGVIYFRPSIWFIFQVYWWFCCWEHHPHINMSCLVAKRNYLTSYRSGQSSSCEPYSCLLISHPRAHPTSTPGNNSCITQSYCIIW